MVNTLLIFNDEVPKQAVTKILQNHYHQHVKFTYQATIDQAIAYLGTQKPLFDIIIFEHKSPSLMKVKSLLSLGSGATFVLYSDEFLDLMALQEEYTLEKIPTGSVEVNLVSALKKFEVMGYLLPAARADDEYISVKSDVVASYCPLNNDVYIKLVDGRFVKLFHKGDPIERTEFDRYQKEKGVEEFFFKKSDHQEILANLVARMGKVAATEPLNEDKVTTEAIKTHSVIKDFVKKMGFTPEAQQVAKSCVAMTIKLLNNKPRLSKILNDMKRREGNYVSAHSISAGTIACAIAHKLDWISAATYFKLSLAAFIHDIVLDDSLAMVQSLSEASASGRHESDELLKIKFHTLHAAEYVRKMSEIPADVDHIVFQHHERPDGSGFPRGLAGRNISPLSAVFIVAHDMVNFSERNKELSLQAFLDQTEELYKQGTFRKIWLALKADLKTEPA